MAAVLKKMRKTKADFDVVIIGGGPAGMSAALWCADLGLTALLLEKSAELGGQLVVTHNPITNYLGAETKNGRELRDIFVRHIDGLTAVTTLKGDVAELDADNLTVKLSNGTQISGNSIVIATGVRRRRLDIPGETEFVGRGMLESGAAVQNAVDGKKVFIIGGGDAALENALILSKKARKVAVIHRGETFRARTEFLYRALENPRIEFIKNTVVTEISGRQMVETIKLRSLDTGLITASDADAILIRIGVVANTGAFQTAIELDHSGFIITNKTCTTSAARIFAIGDVANPSSPTISGATGDAATAIKSAYSLLTAKISS